VSGIGPEGRPRSGRRSWTSTPSGACWKTRRKGSRRLRRSWRMGVECVLHDRCPDSGTAPVGCRSSLPAPRRGMECCDVGCGGRGQSVGATTPSAVGGHDQHDPRPPPLGVVSCRRAARHRRRRWRVESTDVVVTQPVDDEGEQFAGGGHDADVADAASSDPIPEFARAGCGPTLCTASTAAQRTSREPCFVIRPRCMVGCDASEEPACRRQGGGPSEGAGQDEHGAGRGGAHQRGGAADATCGCREPCHVTRPARTHG